MVVHVALFDQDDIAHIHLINDLQMVINENHQDIVDEVPINLLKCNQKVAYYATFFRLFIDSSRFSLDD